MNSALTEKNRYVNSIDFLSEKIEEFVKIMKENKIFSLDILGGEPFLYEPLESLVKLAIDSDIKVTISTNGSFNEKNRESSEHY